MLKNLFLARQKNNSEKYKQWAIDRFIDKHSHSQNTIEVKELKRRLDVEEVRVNALVADSIISERINRAVISFIAVAALTLLFLLLTGGLGSVLTVITPLVTGGIVAAVSIATIEVSAQARQKGAMRSVLAIYEKEFAEKSKVPVIKKEVVSQTNEVLKERPRGETSWVAQIDKKRESAAAFPAMVRAMN